MFPFTRPCPLVAKKLNFVILYDPSSTAPLFLFPTLLVFVLFHFKGRSIKGILNYIRALLIGWLINLHRDLSENNISFLTNGVFANLKLQIL